MYWVLALLLAWAGHAAAAPGDSGKPNIVLVLTDDQGTCCIGKNRNGATELQYVQVPMQRSSPLCALHVRYNLGQRRT